ncbi:MAG: hypothetical protein CMF48_07255 [Legionellales bacterium]|nr:hypothetical protein [Legionellales bacterium]|tara:strand:- start:384 stop:857 length:474 start_codon:yes stop_codon:yes gene_type:complete
MSAHVLIGQYDHTAVLKLIGSLRYQIAPQIEQALHLLNSGHLPIQVDLSQVDVIDSTILGLLVQKLMPQKDLASFIVITDSLHKQLKAIRFDTTFRLISQLPGKIISYTVISPQLPQANEQIRSYVRAAHEELIKIDKQNEKDYRRVIDCLNKKDSQ